MGWRALLHRLPAFDRRWIRRGDEREAHAEVVRERLDSDGAADPADPADSADPDAEGAGPAFATGGWR